MIYSLAMNDKDMKRKKKLALRKKKEDKAFVTIKFPEPSEQTCQVCGDLYTGIRTRLCEKEHCRKWFAMEWEANAWKYGPVSRPSGAIFYLDFKENEEKK